MCNKSTFVQVYDLVIVYINIGMLLTKNIFLFQMMPQKFIIYLPTNRNENLTPNYLFRKLFRGNEERINNSILFYK